MAEKVGTAEQNIINAVSWLLFLKPWCHVEGDYERGRKIPFAQAFSSVRKESLLVQCQMDELTPKTHSVVNNADIFNGVNVVYSHYIPFQ